jgi:hypothetical protein
LDEVSGALVTGSGVTATVVENYRRLNNEELQLLYEQTRALRREMMSESARAEVMTEDSSSLLSDLSTNKPAMMSESGARMESGASGSAETGTASPAMSGRKVAAQKLIEKIERRTGEYIATPANASLASIVMLEVSVAPDAEPGERELRLVTLRGVSNPLAFHVGQLPEWSRKPMVTATKQVLGKEAEALRKRNADETSEERVTLPCTVNGQVGSGEINRYRFEARRGQRLVITTLARQLIPFIADAVPGWFQPVLVLYGGDGKEVAYGDDYRFKPDPTIFYEVPNDGEYVLAIHDSLYRGREDFAYRVTMGELPFITSVFPLGARLSSGANSSRDEAVKPQIKGWNLEAAELIPVASAAGGGKSLLTSAPAAVAGVRAVAARKKGFVSNRVPFALDTLPEMCEQEPNNTLASALKVELPVIINGRIDKPDDWDVFQFNGISNEVIVAEVQARRLDSPLDSVLKLVDAAGNLVAFNDDHEELASGLSTHQADSYFMARLSADGVYYVSIADAARQGGEEYGYRLRLSAPRPDFELRVVPSSLALRGKSSGTLTVYAQRKDGFEGSIKVSLKDPPPGFSAAAVTLWPTQTMARLNIRTDLATTREPVKLSVVGSAKCGGLDLTRDAVPAEDRMQAFLWRQLVPAMDLAVLVFDPAYRPPPKRVAHLRPRPAQVQKVSLETNSVAGTNGPAGTNASPAKPKFSKQQMAGRLRQLQLLFEEGMFTDEFYQEKVAECEAEE